MQQTKTKFEFQSFSCAKQSVKNFERYRNTNFCNSNIIHIDQQHVDSGEFRRVELNQFTAGGI